MKVNGEHIDLEKPAALSTFLLDSGFHAERVAVEHNGRIVPKTAYETTMLSDSDVLEIVHFVGGG